MNDSKLKKLIKLWLDWHMHGNTWQSYTIMYHIKSELNRL